MKNYSLTCLIPPVCAAIVFAGCATTVNVTGQFPARNQAAANLRQIAVAGFQGQGGNDFAAALESELASARLSGNPYFTVMGSGGRASVEQDSARAYGRIVGATGVYFGSITLQARSQPQQMTQNQCVRWENLTCKQWNQVSATCEQRTVSVTVRPRLVNVETGEIAYASEKSGQAQRTWCPGAARQSDGQLVAEIQRSILREVHMDVAPYTQNVPANVMADAGGLAETLSASFQQAVQEIRAGDTQHACEKWSAIRAESPSHMPTVFNLGVCAESIGSYKEALKFYNEAGDLLTHAQASKESSEGFTGWLRSATTNAQYMLNRADDDIAKAKARVTRLMAAQGQINAAEEAQRAEAQRRQDEAAALEQRRQEEAERQRREAAAAREREEAKAAATRRQEEAKIAAVKRQQAEAAAARKRELVSRFGEGAAGAILNGKVIKGMTKEAVIAAIGKPLSQVSASSSEEMWRYPSQQVIFNNGKVSYVGQ